jgi:hypothetical protein
MTALVLKNNSPKVSRSSFVNNRNYKRQNFKWSVPLGQVISVMDTGRLFCPKNELSSSMSVVDMKQDLFGSNGGLVEKLRASMGQKGLVLTPQQLNICNGILTRLMSSLKLSMDVRITEENEVLFMNKGVYGDYFLIVDPIEDELFLSYSGKERGNYYTKGFSSNNNGIDEAVEEFIGKWTS